MEIDEVRVRFGYHVTLSTWRSSLSWLSWHPLQDRLIQMQNKSFDSISFFLDNTHDHKAVLDPYCFIEGLV